MGAKGNRAKLKVVRDELNWFQTSLAIVFLPIYLLMETAKLFFKLLIGPSRNPNRMVGIIRIISMFLFLAYESGFIFEKHEKFIMNKFHHLGFQNDKAEILATCFWICIVLNIFFQFIYVVLLGASTDGSNGYSESEGQENMSGNGIDRAMRSIDYELSMKNSREGQKEVMRDWFGGEK